MYTDIPKIDTTNIIINSRINKKIQNETVHMLKAVMEQKLFSILTEILQINRWSSHGFSNISNISLSIYSKYRTQPDIPNIKKK
jgi:hypothetical protein